MAVAAAVPAAVRNYDADEATRNKLNAEDREQRDFKIRAARCKSMSDLSRLGPFHWPATTNELVCADCFRFGVDSTFWKGGGSGDGLVQALPGVIKGPTSSRAMWIVRTACVEQVKSGMHRWSELRSAEVARQDKEHLKVSMNVGKVVQARPIPCMSKCIRCGNS